MNATRVIARRRMVAFAATVLAIVGNGLADAATFQGLGYLPGGAYSYGTAVSEDGLVVVGESGYSGGAQAFRWTKAGGMTGIGHLPGASEYSIALGVSSDGSAITGMSHYENSNGLVEAFLWTSTGGMVGLGDLAGGDKYSYGDGISGDGKVVVGLGDANGKTAAFRWKADVGMEDLETLPGGDPSTSWQTGRDANADGSVIVGRSHNGIHGEAFRWTAATGMVGLGRLPGGTGNSVATAVSPDGRYVVGSSSSSEGRQAFLWDNVSGSMVGLGDLPGASVAGLYSGEASDVSADGRVVVGDSETELEDGSFETIAFHWTSASGMRSLRDVLTEHGANVDGWVLSSVAAVSSDGLTFVGYGINPNGASEAWVATIPEPHTWAMLTLGCAALAGWTRRHDRRIAGNG